MAHRFKFSRLPAFYIVLTFLLCFSFGIVEGQWVNFTPDVLDTLEENKVEVFRYRMMRLAQAMQTPNQELFDVKYYDLNLDIDPNTQNIIGEVKVLAEVINIPIGQMELNFLDNMMVSKVTIGGSSVTFDHSDDILTITLDRTYNSGEQFEVTVDYSGNPEQSGFGAFVFDTHNGKPMIWSFSDPFGARNWWPCKDVPSDKADSVDIKITVPKDLIVASNGLLRDVIDNGSTKTYWWYEGYPITTYLVSVAIYEYMTYSDYYVYSPGDSMEVAFFVFPDHYDWVRDDYGKTIEMIETFSQLFGQYPFIDEKYGHAEFTWGGGMEHQTITSLGGWSELLIAHELAHQWWGDMITCDDFHHIWLNEGFATYSEALWLEQKYGKDEYHEEMDREQYFGGGMIYVHDLSVGNIFHYGRSYQKGSWVPHMLRHVVGDDTFFDILKAYYNSQHQYGTATTEEFRDICEAVAGMDLDWFFQQWIYEEYYPVYVYEWSWEAGASYKVNLTIEQTQTNTVLFKMPIDITVETVSGETTFVVWDSIKTQEFQLTVDDQPTNLYLDKNNWILKRVGMSGVEKIAPLPISNVSTLYQNYPNPFNTKTSIQYTVTGIQYVDLKVYDMLGREVRTLVRGVKEPGVYNVHWDGRDRDGKRVGGGIYFYRLQVHTDLEIHAGIGTGDYTETKKLILLK
jgi:aminopeptidase N